MNNDLNKFIKEAFESNEGFEESRYKQIYTLLIKREGEYREYAQEELDCILELLEEYIRVNVVNRTEKDFEFKIELLKEEVKK